MGTLATVARRTWRRHLAWLLPLGLLLLVAFALGANDDLHWQTVQPGVQHRVLALRDVQADLVRFDLDHFAVNLVMEGRESAITAAQAAERHGAALAINGGFFDPQWRSLGLRVSEGKVMVPLRARVDWGVLAVANRRAHIVHSRDHQGDVELEAALQVGPRLLVDGQPTKLKPQVAYRSAVAVDKSGRYITIIATQARTDASALAHALARLGEFQDALLLDGGPSSQLYANLGALHLDRKGGYAVPDLLIIKRRH